MLGNELRKEIREQKLKYSLLDSPNASQDLGRAIKGADKVFNELTLMTSNLPNDIQYQIFSYDRIESILTEILNGNVKGLHSRDRNKPIYKGNKKYDGYLASRKLQIASLLNSIAIKIYEDYYENENNVAPNESTFSAIRRLKAAHKECSDLGKTRVTSSLRLKYNVHEPNCKCEKCEKERESDKLRNEKKSMITY